MLDKFYVGQDITSFSDNGEYHAISKVTLVIDDETSVTAGDNTGIEIQAECPFATQQMANAILNSIKGYRYRAYSAEASNIDPSFELGDGVTVSDIYSVISRIDDSGNGYPSISAPGESELQEEYPVVGPTTQEFNRRIESVKKWAEEHNKELKEEIDKSMGEAGKLITGQLGGHYIVTMNPEDGKPNGWALMDTEDMSTAQNLWRATLGGIGHSSNGINGPFNVALTMDGKINASMILTGELWANLIKTGRIESSDGSVYFDLDKDELAASRLVDPNGNVYAIVGTDEDLAADGFFLYQNNKKFGQIYNTGTGAEFLSTDDVTVRSHGGTGKPANLFFMGKDSDGNGRIFINRASGNSYVTPFHMGADGTFLRDPEGRTAFQVDKDKTALYYNGNVTIGEWDESTNIRFKNQDILIGDSDSTSLRVNGKTKFFASGSGTYAYNPNDHAAFQADGDNTVLRNPNDGVVFRGNSTITALQNPSGQEVFQANYLATSVCSPSGNTYINVTDSEIQFVINGAIVAYVDSSGIH